MTGPVSVHPEQLAAGMTALDAAAAGLDAVFKQVRSAVMSLDPWGRDTPGQAARQAYLQGGGPGTILFGAMGGGGLVAALGQIGPAVTQSVAGLTDTDHRNAEAMPPAGA